MAKKKQKSKKTKKKVIKKKPVKKAVKKKTIKKLKKKVIKKVQKKAVKKPIKKAAKKSFKKPSKKIAKPKTEKPIGTVVHWFDKIKVAVVKLKVPMKIGTSIRIKRGDMEFTDTVSSMQFNHAPITAGKKGQEIAIKLKKTTKEGAEIFLLK